MIHPYMFQIKSSPMKMNQNYGKVGGAFVHVWVMDGDPESALSRACDYIRKYLWEPEEVRHAFQPLPEQIAQLEEDELSRYHMALSHGIFGDFFAWLKDEGDPDWPAIRWRP